jgi:hypothetical protein
MVSSVAGTRGNPQPARQPEDAAGHNGQMKAGDHQHVKGAGALKAHAQRVRQVGAVAGDHRGQHQWRRPRLRRSGAGSRRMDAGNASRRLLVACCQPLTRQRKAPEPPDPAVPRVRCGYRRRRGNALVEQEILAAPDAGIAVDLRRQQANHGADALSALERAAGWPVLAERARGSAATEWSGARRP